MWAAQDTHRRGPRSPSHRTSSRRALVKLFPNWVVKHVREPNLKTADWLKRPVLQFLVTTNMNKIDIAEYLRKLYAMPVTKVHTAIYLAEDKQSPRDPTKRCAATQAPSPRRMESHAGPPRRPQSPKGGLQEGVRVPCRRGGLAAAAIPRGGGAAAARGPQIMAGQAWPQRGGAQAPEPQLERDQGKGGQGVEDAEWEAEPAVVSLLLTSEGVWREGVLDWRDKTRRCVWHVLNAVVCRL